MFRLILLRDATTTLSLSPTHHAIAMPFSSAALFRLLRERYDGCCRRCRAPSPRFLLSMAFRHATQVNAKLPPARHGRAEGIYEMPLLIR